MRILHVINNGTTCGGAERLTADLAEAQRAAGHRVSVLAGDREGPGTWFADRTWPVETPRGPLRILRFYHNPGARRALAAALASHQPDVVHLHTVGLLSIGALPVLRDTPTVMTVHGPELFLPDAVRQCLPDRYFRGRDPVTGRLTPRGLAAVAWARVVTGPLTRRTLRRTVDAQVAPSPYLVAAVRRALGDTRLIRNGIPDHLVGGFRASGPEPRSRPRLVMVGRMERSKGPQVLLGAMPAILAAHPDTRLTLVGSGSYEQTLRDEVARLGVGHAVNMVGWLSSAELETVLADAAIAVVPSIAPEAFGLTALEAMAAGCAVVAADRGGLSDLVRDDETGLLVTPGDEASLAIAVIRLLGNPARRARLAAAGHALARRLTVSAHAAQVLRLYESVRSRYPHRRTAVGAVWR